MKRIALAVLAIASIVGFTGCTSAADKVSENLSIEAEKFKIQRSIVGINGITGKAEFQVTGRCSVEGDGLGSLNALTVICKDGPDSFKKHWVGLSDNTFFIITQLKGVDVSEYRTTIVIKPENIVPNLDLITGETP